MPMSAPVMGLQASDSGFSFCCCVIFLCDSWDYKLKFLCTLLTEPSPDPLSCIFYIPFLIVFNQKLPITFILPITFGGSKNKPKNHLGGCLCHRQAKPSNINVSDLTGLGQSLSLCVSACSKFCDCCWLKKKPFSEANDFKGKMFFKSKEVMVILNQKLVFKEGPPGQLNAVRLVLADKRGALRMYTIVVDAPIYCYHCGSPQVTQLY